MTYTIDCTAELRPGTRSYLTHLTSASLFTVIVAGPSTGSPILSAAPAALYPNPDPGWPSLPPHFLGLIKKLLIADFLSNNVANASSKHLLSTAELRS